MIGLGVIPAFVSLLVPTSLSASIPANLFADWISKKDEATLVLCGASLLATFFLLKNLYIAALVYAESQLAVAVTTNVSKRLFQGYLYSPYTFHLQRNPAELVRNITEESIRSVDFLKASMRILRESLISGVVFLLLLFFDSVVTLTVFIMLSAASAVFYFAVRRSLIKRGRLSLEHWGRQVQVINQALGAIKDIKMLGRESHIQSLLNREVDSLQRHESFCFFLSALPRLFLEILAVGAILFVSVTFLILGRPVQAMLPLLTLFGVAVVRLIPSITNLNSSLTEFRYKRPAFDLVCTELGSLERLTHESHTFVMEAKPVQINHAIHLEQIRYRYPGASSEAIQGISAVIKVGEAVAFIGVSGSGKSTLIDILLGLIKPISGRISVDGIDIHENLPSWQRQIGYIPQDIYLVDESIRRNIAFGLEDEEINEEALAHAVEAAQLGDFVRRLPQGLSTKVGNRGIRLSGGQRQRIGIARALYYDPNVLVMDEATSALDNETEREVIEAITPLRGGRTIILVAHRLTTVKNCDRLYVLEEGTVKDCGCFTELSMRYENLRVRPGISSARNIGAT
jgi:ATP-binding cassette subfamily C protein